MSAGDADYLSDPRDDEAYKGALKGAPGLLLNDQEVRAIRSRKKTQLRLPMKPQPVRGYDGYFRWQWKKLEVSGPVDTYPPVDPSLFQGWIQHAPYRVGMCPWVRETWRLVGLSDGQTRYAADYPRRRFHDFKWDSGVHMPRWAARLALEVTDVRVEWLQQITEDDARAEGVYPQGKRPFPHIRAFREFWNSVDSRSRRGGYLWADNPFVFVIGFRPIVLTIDVIEQPPTKEPVASFPALPQKPALTYIAPR